MTTDFPDKMAAVTINIAELQAFTEDLFRDDEDSGSEFEGFDEDIDSGDDDLDDLDDCIPVLEICVSRIGPSKSLLFIRHMANACQNLFAK